MEQRMYIPRVISRSHVASLLLMAAGWGWINGNFVQPVAFWWGDLADIFHFLPFVALLLLSMSFVRSSLAGKRARGARIGISIVAVFSILVCVVFVLAGLSNPDPNSVGVHTFEDAMPVIVLNLGTLLWLATLVSGPGRRAAQPTIVEEAANQK